MEATYLRHSNLAWYVGRFLKCFWVEIFDQQTMFQKNQTGFSLKPFYPAPCQNLKAFNVVEL